MVRTLILYGQLGTSVVTDPRIAYVNMLMVRRRGLEYDLVSGTPVNRQCRHDPASGSVIFDSSLPFTNSLADPDDFTGAAILSENVSLIYEI